MNQKDIRQISNSELEDFLVNSGEKKFRVKQIKTWIWKRGAVSFDEMTDISANLRNKLKENFTFLTSSIEKETQSADKTTKFLIKLHDGKLIEGVLIPQAERVTACLSTQVGCPLKCTFCATGTLGFARNLHYSEIFDEFNLLNVRSQNLYNHGITNIVFMGMGEPLLNLENLTSAVKILTDKDFVGMSPSRITISTAGIVKGVKELADKNLRCGLAISLHSADPMIRGTIMPVSEHNRISELRTALEYYHKQTGDRITIEYLLLADVNDSERDAELLARFCRAFPVKINIIEYNETEDSPYKKSKPEAREKFIAVLNRCNMVVNVRKSKGQDIAAACGQLARKNGRKSGD